MIFCATSNVTVVNGSVTIYFESGSLYVAYSDVVNNGTAYSISANTWYHAAITYNSGTTTLYVNGVQSGSSISGTNSKSGFSLGGSADSGRNYPFTGYLDDLRIFTSVLSVAQISNIYANNTLATTTVAGWYDKSGNGNNFTPSAGTVTTSTDNGYPVVNFPSGAIMTSSQQITFTPASAFYTVFRMSTLSGQGLDYVIGFTNATVGQTGDQGIRIGGSGLYGAGTLTGGAQDVGNNNYYVNGFFNPTFPLSTFSNTFVMVGTTVCSSTTTSYITISTAFSSRFFIGNMCELLYYPAGLTSTQRQQVEGYLASKWNLQTYLPGATFSPLTVSGCVLWLDASDSSTLTLSSGNMTQWRDKSGVGNTMTAYSTYSNVTVSSGFQNGLNALNFSGGGVYRTPASSAVYPLDMYAVVALKDLTTAVDVLGMGATSTDNFNSLTFGEYTASRWHNGSSFFNRTPNCVSPTNETLTSFVLIQWSIADSNYLLRRNGTQLVQTASYTFTLTSGSVFQLGLRYPNYTSGPPSNPFRGYIGEILIFSNVLTTTQRQSVENYLMRKWGITSVVTHPFKNIPPSTSAPPQFQEVTPGNWTYDWQPYLSNLTRANNSANSTVIPTLAYGTGGPSLSPALSTQGYKGGVLGPNGTIYGIPFPASNILMINTATNGVSYGTNSLSPALSTQNYIGGVLAPNGTIYCIPFQSSNILMINTATNGVSYGTGGPSLSPALSTQKYYGGVLGPNGTIYGIPYTSSNILMINTATNGVSYGTGGPSLSPALSTQYYLGGVLAPNGTIYCIPGSSSNILMINTATNGVSYGTGGPSLSPALSTQNYYGCVLGPNGTIYGIPYTSSNILMINTVTNGVSYGTGGPSLSPALSTQGYIGGVLAPNGNIYCIPYAASNTLIINTATNGVSYGTNSLSPALSTQYYYGGVLAPNGTIYCVPGGASNILRISNTYTENPSSNYCLSPWTNKL
jgi:hypothetical protein